MRKKRLWLAAGLALVLLLSVREYFDPFLILFIDDILFPKPAPLTARLSDAVTFRLYSDTRPHIGKIDLLQKGLVLLYHGEPVIEEGYGFGLPIIVQNNQPNNTRHAEVIQLDANTLVKRYTMDTADRWSKFLQVKYKPTPPLGVVVVTYTLHSPDTVAVSVDFTGLTAEWDAAYVMNEQGARAFPIYEDADGRQRHGSGRVCVEQVAWFYFVLFQFNIPPQQGTAR